MQNNNSQEIASVETVVTAKADTIKRTTRNERERLQLGGFGVNAFGGFCSDGVNVSLGERINASKATLDEQTINGESETVWHLTESVKHGLHAGTCERFKNLTLADGTTADVLLRTLADGTRVYYTADACKGFALVSDAELLALASEKRDLRQFRQKVREIVGTNDKGENIYGKTFTDGALVKGALVREGLTKDFNAVVYRTADGLNVRTIMTRKCKEHENEFFVETSAVKDVDALASEIFDGVKIVKAKDAVKNATKKARAAAVKAKKAAAKK